MTPRRLSHFELYEELGSGGMGLVYRALDTRLQRPVAIKTLPPIAADDGQRARFLTEARAASALNHPGIVTIYEVGSEDDVDFIAMELVEGRSRSSPLSCATRPTCRRIAAAASPRAGIRSSPTCSRAILVRAPDRAAQSGEGYAPSFQFRLFSDFSGSHREPTLAPDGSSIAFVTEDAAGVAQIWVRSWAGGDPIQVTRGEAAAFAPRWARAGDRIVFSRRGEGIWEVPPLGGHPHRLVDRGAHADLSPAGDRLVFVRELRLWLSRGDGSDPQPIEALAPIYFGYLGRAAFSPEGTQLVAYWPLPERPYGDFWRIDVASGAARRITELEFTPAGAPVWSGDGRSILFASNSSRTANECSTSTRAGPTAATPCSTTARRRSGRSGGSEATARATGS